MKLTWLWRWCWIIWVEPKSLFFIHCSMPPSSLLIPFSPISLHIFDFNMSFKAQRQTQTCRGRTFYDPKQRLSKCKFFMSFMFAGRFADLNEMTQWQTKRLSVNWTNLTFIARDCDLLLYFSLVLCWWKLGERSCSFYVGCWHTFGNHVIYQGADSTAQYISSEHFKLSTSATRRFISMAKSLMLPCAIFLLDFLLSGEIYMRNIFFIFLSIHYTFKYYRRCEAKQNVAPESLPTLMEKRNAKEISSEGMLRENFIKIQIERVMSAKFSRCLLCWEIVIFIYSPLGFLHRWPEYAMEFHW